MANDFGALTNQWMVNPTMFDPTQASNQFSQYNNARIPYPPTYNGVPTNAMGQPIQSYLDWQTANPGGMTLNSTPAQPQAPAPNPMSAASQSLYQQGLGLTGGTNAGMNQYQGQAGADVNSATGQALMRTASALDPTLGIDPTTGKFNTSWAARAQQQQAAPQAARPSGPPNNWNAAISALANPGNPVTQGANVPLQTGFQPAGGVNQAFLQQAGAGQGMNQNFLGALRAIQGRG